MKFNQLNEFEPKDRLSVLSVIASLENLRISGSPPTAEIMQELFLKLPQHLRDVAQDCYRDWLLSISGNKKSSLLGDVVLSQIQEAIDSDDFKALYEVSSILDNMGYRG